MRRLADEALEAEWASLLEVRGSVNAALEVARQAKTIGNALSRRSSCRHRPQRSWSCWKSTARICRCCSSRPAADVRQGTGDAVGVEVKPASGDKCARCWRYVSDLEAAGPYTGLCSRCVDAVGAAVGTSG
jgi:isoleucyl-tRNA synthetase